MLTDTLKTLLAVYGPSGREEKVAETVKKLLSNADVTFEKDTMGNLFVEKKGSGDGKVIMLSAHMDQIGLIVTDIEKDGFLRVTNVGGIGKDVYTPRAIVFENGVRGVVTCQPVKGAEPALSDLFVDIGAESRGEAEEKVMPGDICVFAPAFSRLGEYRVSAPAMDDRCACALLAELMLSVQYPRNTLIACFSVQEEVGLRGAAVAAYGKDPDLGIGLDVTAWGDTPETKLPAVRLGNGAAVKYMDRSLVCSPFVRDALIAAANECGAAWQPEILPFGGNDAGAIQHARAGIPAGTLSIPCRYVHSACETIDMRDMDAALEILKTIADAEL